MRLLSQTNCRDRKSLLSAPTVNRSASPSSKMSSPTRATRTRAATRKQPTPVARRRASAARRAVYIKSEGESSDNSSSSSSSEEKEEEPFRASKKPRRAAQQKQKQNGEQDVASSEPNDGEQIQHECALIDAVCAATAEAITRSAPCPRVSRAKAAVKSAGRLGWGGGSTTLCEVGERLMMSFLAVLPDRLKAESVCKRWRQISVHGVAMTELDFDKVVLRSVNKKHVIQILQRANGQLRRLALPDMRIDDTITQSVVSHTDLRVFRAHKYSIAYELCCGYWRPQVLTRLLCVCCHAIGCKRSTSSSFWTRALALRYVCSSENI